MKPKILLLVDKKNWAFDFISREISKRLKVDFNFKTYYVSEEKPILNEKKIDLLYVFFWGERYWKRFNIPYDKVLKEVASYRWRDDEKFGKISAEAFCRSYLNDCNLVTTPCKKIESELKLYRNNIFHTPNGIDLELFRITKKKTGPLKIGWAGNPKDSIKGLQEILLPSTEKFDFIYTDGNLSRENMVEFYNQIDVLAIASLSESQPLPLIEAMACGCFIVTTDVGIAPEIIESIDEGLIISRKIESFKNAFLFCKKNIDYIRSRSQHRSIKIRDERNWDILAPKFKDLFTLALDSRDSSKGLPDAIFNTGEIILKNICLPRHPEKEVFGDYYEHLGFIQGDFENNHKGNFEQNYKNIKSYLSSEIKSLLPVDKNSYILEIGPGFGYLINILVDFGYKNIFAVDLSEKMIKLVDEKFKGRIIGTFWCEGSEFLSCNPNIFDVVILYDVIEHIDPKVLSVFLINLKKSLTKGGKVIVRTPNMALPLSGFSRYIDITHKNGFTEFSLRQAFLGCGFSRFEISTQPRKSNLTDEILFRIYRFILRKLYLLENRTLPTCFEKNILAEIQ